MTSILRHSLSLALLLAAGAAQAANVSFELHAVPGSATLPTASTPGAQAVPVLGYATSAGATVASPGGPVLVVNQGDVVTVNLHNGLAEPTALLLQGQAMVPDQVGVAPGGTKAYSFTAAAPGTFRYEAGLLPNAQHQSAMGLFGALVVRPAGAPGQAYSDAATAFDVEAVLVLSEVDPALNGAAIPAGFDMRAFAPRFFLINGIPYPGTTAIGASAGQKVLLRYVNAGNQPHSMTLLGIPQLLVGKDGQAIAHPGRRTAETIAPGETLDVLVEIPATASGRYALFDGSLNLFNNRLQGAGGMLTFLSVAAGAPVDAGPVVTSLSVSADLTSVGASFDAGAGHSLATAQFWVDSGTPVAMTVTGSTATGAIPQPVSPGAHTVSVRGQNDAGTWGAARTIDVSLDTAGPITSALVLAPSHANGSAPVQLTGTADDRTTGGSTIAGAEYAIDGGAATAAVVTPAGAQVASLSASIPAATVLALAEGPHAVAVRAQDALGNWGAAATTTLVADRTGPSMSAVSASPPANNGSFPLNSSLSVVRLTATATDALSSVAGGEGYIDTVGAPGTGFVLVASDGNADSQSETLYGDIPLGTIAALSTGNHTLLVRGKDAAGNWGGTASIPYLIDRAAPTLTGLTLSPTTVAAGGTTTATAVGAADTGGSGLAGGQWWIGTSATPPANATPFTGTSATIPLPTGGLFTVYLRVRDAAGNWSPVRSAGVAVVQAINDARSITANTSTSQTSDASAGAGLLANDLPAGSAGRTARLASAPVRTAGTGQGTLAVSCPSSLGTPATPAIGGNTVCTNGAYRVTLTGVGNNGTQRRASKRGTFQFTYTETLNGASSTATVAITVN
jgi:FtsP/CotA-like multicopper oxidase with cupredoxin domain